MRVAGECDAMMMENLRWLDYHEMQMAIVISGLTRWSAG
jgi:hypothetical protein